MTKDEKALAKLAANAETVGLDPVLKRQIEMELHAGYAFNAETAKYGVVTVWIPRLLAIGAGIGALYCFVILLGMLVTQSDIRFIDLDPPREEYLISARIYDWILYLFGAVAFSGLTVALRYFSIAMARAQDAAMRMASQYKKESGLQ